MRRELTDAAHGASMRHSPFLHPSDAAQDAAGTRTFGQKGAGESFRAATDDVIDADFETIRPGAAAGKMSAAEIRIEPREPRFQSAPADGAGMALFSDTAPAPAARDDRIAFYGFGALLVAFAFWVSGGHAVMTRLTAPAPEIVLADAQWRIDETGVTPALVVEGVLHNKGALSAPSRGVTVVVARSDGTRIITTVGAGGWRLAPGQDVVVSGRLDMAPLDITRASIASVDIALATVRTH